MTYNYKNKGIKLGSKTTRIAAFSVATAVLMGTVTAVFAEGNNEISYTDGEYSLEQDHDYPACNSEDDNHTTPEGDYEYTDESETSGDAGKEGQESDQGTEPDYDGEENYEPDEEEYDEEKEDELYPLPEFSSSIRVINDVWIEDITVEFGETVRIVDGGSLTGTIFVNAGGELHLEDGGAINGTVILNGFGALLEMNGGVISGQGRGVQVEFGARFNKNGGTVSGNIADNGGGVLVSGAGSVFTMTDGTIVDNTATGATGSIGGGIKVTDGATFNLHGGVIEGNTAQSGGGVALTFGSTLNMTGGLISGNDSVSLGAGVRVSSSTFAMSGGEISHNAGNGVHLNDINPTFEMTGGTIANNEGRGVAAATIGSMMAMSGGTISNNNDGGVQVAGIFNMFGSALIDGNRALTGAGVNLVGESATFNMNGGVVQNNTSVHGDDIFMPGV